jgi:hypothetical protein
MKVYVRVKLQLNLRDLKLIEIVFKFSNSIMKPSMLKLLKNKKYCLLWISYRTYKYVVLQDADFFTGN